MSYHGLGISIGGSASVDGSGASGSVKMTAPGSASCDPFQGETTSCCAAYGGVKGPALMRGDRGDFVQKCNNGMQAQRQGWGGQVVMTQSTPEGVVIAPAARDTEAESLAALAALANYAKQQEALKNVTLSTQFQKAGVPVATVNTRMAQLAAQQRAGGAAAIAEANRRYQEAAPDGAGLSTAAKVGIGVAVALAAGAVWYNFRGDN